MKKQMILGIGIAALILIASPLYADTSSLSEFVCTIEKLEISKDGGGTWFTVFKGSTAKTDMMALSGSNVGTVMGSNKVPAGTYDKSRVHITYSKIVIDYTDTDGNNADITASDGVQDLTREYDGNVTVTPNGTTRAVINLDAASSYTITATDWDGDSFEDVNFTFEPQITIVE